MNPHERGGEVGVGIGPGGEGEASEIKKHMLMKKIINTNLYINIYINIRVYQNMLINKNMLIFINIFISFPAVNAVLLNSSHESNDSYGRWFAVAVLTA